MQFFTNFQRTAFIDSNGESVVWSGKDFWMDHDALH